MLIIIVNNYFIYVGVPVLGLRENLLKIEKKNVTNDNIKSKSNSK